MLEHRHFRIHAENVAPSDTLWFAELAVAAWDFVLSTLETPETEGWPTFWPDHLPRVVDIRVNDETAIPGTWWRPGAIDIFIPSEKLRNRRDSCIAHELTHLLAPSQGKPDRMLDEGLAVHVQELFDTLTGDCSYPTLGKPLHEETRKAAAEAGSYIPLATVESARNASSGGPLRRQAYLQEGSFVRYSIEKFGIGSHLSMHFGEAIKDALGFTQAELEDEWLSFLQASSE